MPPAPIVKVCAAFAPSTSGVRLTLTATDLRAEAKTEAEETVAAAQAQADGTDEVVEAIHRVIDERHGAS